MTIIESIILGAVQGLTEFLPVSSSGHLVLFQKIFGLESGALSFDIALHLATALAVIWVFRDELIRLAKNPFSKEVGLLALGTVPAVVFALVFSDFIDRIFASGGTLGFEFLITAGILLFADRYSGKRSLELMTAKDALIIGTGQAIAILPAISRSGTTIAAGLVSGLNRETALKFSFLLSIPAILGAGILDAMKGGLSGSALLSPIYLAGMIASFIFGIFAIRFMLRIFSRKSLKPFAAYVAALGILIIFDQFLTHIFF